MVGARLLGWLNPAADEAELDWEAAYRQELPRVYNFFRYRVGDRDSAEDLTSATFEKAWRARHRYRADRASVATWLLAIARNVAVDHRRRARVEIPIEEAPQRDEETPERTALRDSDQKRLLALLSELAPRERELVSLKYGGGVTNRAIAQLTGLSESNVGTILHRTIDALRARWDEGAAR
jgi:RNA polymerase sigma-70 factor (ECF subfamily)